MRLSVPVAIVLFLAASMPAFAAPSSSSNNPQLEQRSPLFGPLGLIEDAFKIGKVRSSAVLAPNHRTERERFGLGYLQYCGKPQAPQPPTRFS
jgi:hypothetical protein